MELTKASIEKAATTGSPTPRERAYIAAVAQLVTAADPGSHAARIGAYEAAMEKLSREYPADTEARIFYALAVNQTAPPTDKTYAKNLKAAGILEPLFGQMPTHPGLAHYIIHAYDAPPLAEKALVAARKYASLAPAIPHALHMPSHTFTRVGSWKESIDTNRRSADAARKSNGTGEELHALDYQTYAYLQIAQDTAAKAVLDRATEAASGGDRSRQLVRDCRHPGALCAGARQLGGCRRADADVRRTPRLPKRSRTSRAPSARPAAAIRRRPPPTSSAWPRCATRRRSSRTRTGPSKSTFSAASRWRGRPSRWATRTKASRS